MYNPNYPVTVGTFTLTEAREVTEFYECAAWHKTIKVEPGVYEVVAYFRKGFSSERVSVKFDGVVSSCCLVSRLGSHYGPDRGPEQVGNVDTIGESFHLYDAVDDGRFEWNDRIVFERVGEATAVTVTPDELADIELDVETVNTYCVNRGHETEAWLVTASVRSNKYGYRAFEHGHRFEGEGEARRFVARVEASGKLCPAYWSHRHY